MRIAVLASEGAPYAKSGGLGDVMEALPSALAQIEGNEVVLILPYYKKIKDNPAYEVELVKQFSPGADVFTTKEWQEKYPCYVLAPQCPENMSWPVFTELLIFTLASISGEFPIDSCRKYVTGVSMGGAGTWNLLCHSPRIRDV